ncbi:MAG TPA: HYR domain-containing protein [Pyrinomonadaceae bacterium]|nr:HYR domain-containing protein [Pyrinomonadaceae bacterium]
MISNSASRQRRFLRRGARHGAAIFITLLAAVIIYSASFVAPARSAAAPQPPTLTRAEAEKQSAPAAAATAERLSAALPGPAFALAPVFQLGEETITTYAADCTTPKSVFTLGETVCAKVENAPQPPRPTRPLRRFSWVGTANTKRQQTIINATSQSDTFMLPTTSTSTIGGVLVDNRGDWTVVSTNTADGSSQVKAVFAVRDPQQPSANISVNNFHVDGGEVFPGQNALFRVSVVNRGPDAAENVELTSAVANATFASGVQVAGPSFTCVNPSTGSTDASTCSIASLPADAEAVFTFSYETGPATPGQVVTNTAATTSDTEDSRGLDNSSTASALVVAETPNAECALECPTDIVVTANATQGTESGAFVTFGAAEPFGGCGTITSSHASGSFFPVGTTVVTSTSSTGGGSCSFSVIVTAGGGPTISCPANITAAAESGCSATVADLGTPTTTGDGVTVTGQRSDDEALDAPYPVGTTTITWTARDNVNRIATCTQTVTITPSGNDTAPPTITAPDDLTLNSGAQGGACGLIVGEGLLGTAEATDDGCNVTISRTGVPAGNFFPVGTTTIMWTATDSSGNTATDTQTVTVVENTPPVIHAPADESYTCLSEVPAASASQATGAGTFDGNGNPIPGPPSDNCGVPVVTITETQTGAGNTASPRIITRTFTATDAAGNTASDDQVITVIDPTPPTITAPGDVSVNADPVACAVTGVALGTATADDNCSVTVTNNAPASFPLGTTTVTWTATDGGGNTATDTQTVTVTDVTAPVITVTGANPFTVECHTSFTDPGATAADACDASVPVSASGSVDVNTPGTYTITYTATDDSGNAAAPVTRTVNVVDTTPPVMDCPDNITINLPLNSTATSMAVTYPAATANDSCGGALPVTYSHASGSVFNVGTTTVTATATDAHGNTASCTFTVTVLYNFTGFFSPVSNPPTFNNANAGRALPLKFSLSGNKGLGIMAAGYPASQQIACNTSAPISELEGTETSGGSTLTYSPDQYHYNWKTESGWAGTCRVLVVKLNDGSEHTALFKFK